MKCTVYGYGVAISIVFEISGHFMFMGRPPCTIMTYLPSDVTRHKKTSKNIYGIGVGISMVFEILGHFLSKGNRTTMYMTYIPSDAP
jgi:hypothetical protein